METRLVEEITLTKIKLNSFWKMQRRWNISDPFNASIQFGKWNRGWQFCHFSLQLLRGNPLNFYSHLFHSPIGNINQEKQFFHHINLLNFSLCSAYQILLGRYNQAGRRGLVMWHIQGVTGGTDQTSGGCSLC